MQDSTASGTAGIVVRDVVQRFGDKAVLSGLDMTVHPGEFVALLGRSGSGKSTLLRLLAGLDSPVSGTVDVASRPAYAFQEARLLPWERVTRNVLFGFRGGSRRHRQELALHALKEVGLEHRADAWPGTLSGGEAQRASLARALIREPEVLLLDEPFGALDALTRLDMQRMVVDLWMRHRPTIVMVTHDVGEAVRLADRVLVLDNGRIVSEVSVRGPRPRSPLDPTLRELELDLVGKLGVPLA